MGKKVLALDGIDLRVEPGTLFGLLGPNGAGKTTTVKVLLDLARPTAGTAHIFGIPVSDPKSRLRVGYLPEGHRFPGYLTARQTLSIFARMSGLAPKDAERRALPLLERLRIADWIDVRVKKFSKGMTQRLGLAAALIHDPALLLLDEPTDGVDPVGRREIRDLLKDEARNGKTIFLNSHLLSEIELTCDSVAVLRKGKIAAAGTVEELTRRESKYKFAATPISDRLVTAFRASGASAERVNGHVVVSVRDLEHLNTLVDQARAEGAMLTELTPMRSSLEDVFVDLVRTDDPGAEVRS